MTSLREVLAASTAVVLLAGGCATFRAGTLDVPRSWPESSAAKRTISLSVYSQIRDDSVNVVAETGAPGMGIWTRRVQKAYDESGLFMVVEQGRSTGPGATDLYADVRTTQRMSSSTALSLLSAFTLFLVPSITTTDFTVTTTFKDGKGNVLGTIEKSQRVSTVIELFMVFAMPSNFPTSEVARTFAELNWATLKEAKAKGWI